jgi:very-short-patch-repair endonuclease
LRSERETKAEKFIGKAFLSGRRTGVRFLRQRPIGYDIVDFFASDITLVIEIDGSSHMNSGEKYFKK